VQNNIVFLLERATSGSSFQGIENKLFLLLDCNEKREKAPSINDCN
jgi:hypothetical protein